MAAAWRALLPRARAELSYGATKDSAEGALHAADDHLRRVAQEHVVPPHMLPAAWRAAVHYAGQQRLPLKQKLATKYFREVFHTHQSGSPAQCGHGSVQPMTHVDSEAPLLGGAYRLDIVLHQR